MSSASRALWEIASASLYLDGNISDETVSIGGRDRLFDERLILIVNTVSRDAAAETPRVRVTSSTRGDRTRLLGMFRSLAGSNPGYEECHDISEYTR